MSEGSKDFRNDFSASIFPFKWLSMKILSPFQTQQTGTWVERRTKKEIKHEEGQIKVSNQSNA